MSHTIDDAMFLADEKINLSVAELTRTFAVFETVNRQVRAELEERTYRFGSSNPGPTLGINMTREDARALGEFLLDLTKD